MAVLLYDLIIFLFRFGVRCKALVDNKARLWVQGRQGLFKKLNEEIRPGQKLIWMHVSSLGEFEQGKPVLQGLQVQYPDYRFLVTFFSPSGYEIARKQELGCTWSYLPIDTAKNARKFIDTVQPAIAIFIKYDFWYYFLTELVQRDIPFFFVSSKFRPGQWLFKHWGRFMLKKIRMAAGMFVQDGLSADLLKAHAFPHIHITGDTRIDRVIDASEEPYSGYFDRISMAKPVFLAAGSTWPGDEAVITPWINNHSHPVIIAPHDIGEQRLQQIASSIDRTVQRLSTLEQGDTVPAVTLVDSIGELKYLYRFAQIAYIGGGFYKGIHNILEAAVYGIPVIFGPRYDKFPEAARLVEEGAAFVVNDAAEFKVVMDQLSHESVKKEIAGTLKEFFDKHRGATEKVITEIARIISK